MSHLTSYITDDGEQFNRDVTVSIGMPVYNDEKFLHSALTSILAQSFKDFELIISDDKSTDGSSNICKEFAASDSRITYIRQERNLGISRNMKFLLENAKGKYFMWAANDDIWATDFMKLHVKCLKCNIDSVVAFGTYALIDEKDNLISHPINIDFSGSNAFNRLTSFIKKTNDAFGYGLFVKEKIQGIRFPVWLGINSKCAYDNIYPALCYSLALGNYSHVASKEPLWFNRCKSLENINHQIPFGNYFLLAYFSYFLRKLNLVIESTVSIYRANRQIHLVIKIFPRLLFSWFLIPVFYNIHKKYSSYIEKGASAFI